MAVEIREPDPTSYDALVELRMARSPRLRRAQAEWNFVHADEMEVFAVRAAYVDGVLAGWGNTLRGPWFPPGFAIVNVTVSREHERRGVGGALYRALVTTLPPSVEMLGVGVEDDDPASLEVALAHGYEVVQHGIDSELPLVDLPEPELAPGVTVEDATSLQFPDEDEVEEMLVDSQTNPEAAEGFVSRLADYRRMTAKAEQPIAALARVDGAPAAIIIGEISEGVLGIAYTGVGKRFRGRNLAFTLKQYGHRLAAEAGATLCHTMNEESNAGIRHVNAKLGYVVTGGVYRTRGRRELVT
ncbi:GNAT family N-acetyltransferase [Nocardioides antri]|uniref:GNAT family N-acetyltransferase n=1 Tax=Nocardioides antri TaxID=2607659 RepID=A0A5B1M6K3_9ACTN|nr:GNAT family N-acetyltransferase [Nocardioides antri]KAA1428461.1 GNAT family N-acetyltransferase [Nocardioides antri]